jgi:hypothetical protein
MKLLYIYAQWHALAKLRMHHDMTLKLLDYTTTLLGAQTRLFNHETCSKISTKELRKESEAREKREGGTSTTRKAVKFNIFTIKFHFLGDYADSIRSLGTSDSYSTETVSIWFSAHMNSPIVQPFSTEVLSTAFRENYSIGY